MKDEEKEESHLWGFFKGGMIRSFFVPFVHSLHIEISLNLSVFLRDSLSENTSFTSFTVVSVSAILYSVLK
mgnify:CR=1 FL=1